MKLVLTDSTSQQEIIVETDLIRIIEPAASGTGTHLVFDSQNGRDVNESIDQIASIIGEVAPAPVLSQAKK